MRNLLKGMVGSRDKSFWIRVAIAAVLLVGGSAVYVASTHVWQHDYTHALGSINQTVRDYNDMLSARDAVIASVGASNSSFETHLKQYDRQYDTYTRDVSQLADERAMRTSSVRHAYDALQQKDASFRAYVDDHTALLTVIHQISIDCSDQAHSKFDTSSLSKVVKAYDTATKKCATDMSVLAHARDADAARRGRAATAYFASTRAHVVAMQTAYKSGDKASFKKAYDAFLASDAKFDQHVRVTDLLVIDKSVAPTDELNRLAAVVHSFIK